MAASNPAPAWRDAAIGLEVHVVGVVLRLVVVGATLLWLFSRGDHGGSAEMIAAVLAVAETLTITVALVGAVCFARAFPVRSGSMVRLAPVYLLGAVALASGYTGWVMLQLAERNGRPTVELSAHLDRLPTIAIIAALAGVLAMLAILGGVATAGGALGNARLATRARNVQALLLVVPISCGVSLKLLGGELGGGVALAALVGLTGFAIVVAVSYVLVLRAAAVTMRAAAG